MSNNDDYLWTKTGPPDEEVVRLEQLLSGFAHRAQRRPAATLRRKRAPRVALALAATLALCALGVAAWLQHRLAWPAGEPWKIVSTEGDVRMQGGGPAGGFLPGSEVTTGEDGRIRIGIARLGELSLGPGSRLRLERTRTGQHRVRLVEGRMRARVWAPPMHFGVQLPGASALDLGCEFVVRTDIAGNGELTVLSGWVLVDAGSDEVLVPANASVAIRGNVAGTPHDRGASDAFLQALRAIDADEGAVASADPRIRKLVDASRPEDAISLLSLLQRNPRLVQGPLYERLHQILPQAPPVDRTAVLNRKANALDPWWDALPYPRAKQWWLQWEDAFPAIDRG